MIQFTKHSLERLNRINIKPDEAIKDIKSSWKDFDYILNKESYIVNWYYWRYVIDDDWKLITVYKRIEFEPIKWFKYRRTLEIIDRNSELYHSKKELLKLYMIT